MNANVISSRYVQEEMNTMSCEFVKLSQRRELKGKAAEWFASKWDVPLESYLESIESSFAAIVPSWYVCLENGRIVAGMGVIANDFHERKDLRPNVCAVYTEPEYRSRGIAGKLLDLVCEDMHSHGVDTLYLLTDHTGFYERHGWKFHCLVWGDGAEKPSRMYVHEQDSFSLKSERLIIAPMQLDELQETIRKQEVPELRQAFQEMMDACLKEPEHRVWYAPWKISLADKPTEIIGELGFRGPAVDGAVEIGYGLEPGFEGHGYMTEAVRTVIQWAFSFSEVTTVDAETAPGNIASQKILARLDFIPCGMGVEGPRFKKTNGE